MLQLIRISAFGWPKRHPDFGIFQISDVQILAFICIQSTSEIRTVRISDVRSSFRFKFVQQKKTAKIWTNLFGFRTFSVVRKPNMVVRTFGFRSIDLTYTITPKSERRINRTSENRTSINRPRVCSDFGVVWLSDVRFSDVYYINIIWN